MRAIKKNLRLGEIIILHYVSLILYFLQTLDDFFLQENVQLSVHQGMWPCYFYNTELYLFTRITYTRSSHDVNFSFNKFTKFNHFNFWWTRQLLVIFKERTSWFLLSFSRVSQLIKLLVPCYCSIQVEWYNSMGLALTHDGEFTGECKT